MANQPTTMAQSETVEPATLPGSPKYSRWRFWSQTAFLALWLTPISALQRIPSCVFHCYSCPLSSFACPVGVVAQFCSLGLIPFLAIGIVVTVGAMFGSLVCGWACPFGFLQDLIAKIPLPKFRLPNWLGYGRYLVLLGLVILVPMLWGMDNHFAICRVCPAGGIEGALPWAVKAGAWAKISFTRYAIIGGFLLAALLTFRPWCKIFCPLGGFLSLFNRFSLFHLKFKPTRCVECNTCRSRCSMGVEVEKQVNTKHCIRCLECTTCGAIQPAVSLEKKEEK